MLNECATNRFEIHRLSVNESLDDLLFSRTKAWHFYLRRSLPIN